ncbi:hypothetical protein [Acinetobacter baumannii]|uniref:hypothetical protein n=2 Tax=Acinetobacter baumannii TaxID=470 RepID=UPI00165F6D2E|nr:hypothetical protein [Acinetobacter baumannii]MBD0230615.1 hypothetical protein [Acinetobacter baumannii]
MINSEFRLLCESLGFYSPKSIVVFLNQFEPYIRINERPVEYWLKGRKTQTDPIPEDIQQFFLSIQKLQLQIVERERKNLSEGKLCTFKYVFKDPIKMWHKHSELQGLPVNFLNQVIIRLGLKLDYYENNEFLNNEDY